MMRSSFESILFKLKAVLCVVLILHMNFWLGGCGLDSSLSNVLADAAKNGQVRIPITADMPLAQALANTQFCDAQAIDLFTETQTFSFVFPDANRHITGAYTVPDNNFTLTEITLEAYGKWVTFKFDGAKQVISIQASDGSKWERGKSGSSLVANSYASGVQAYVDANADIVAAAQEGDLQAGNTGFNLENYLAGAGGSSGGGAEYSGKPSAAFLLPVLMVLTPLAPILGVLGFLQPLVIMFAIVSAVSAMLTVRFDGTWTMATPVVAGGLSPPNVLVITGGLITEMRTTTGGATGAGYTWEIKETRLISAMGQNVKWQVIADLVVQPIPNKVTVRVAIGWDMTEVTAAPDTRALSGNISMDVGQVNAQGPADMHSP